MTDEGAAADTVASINASSTSALLPAGTLRSLRTLVGADIATIYLSEPAAPYARSSYVLLDHDGLAPEDAMFMRGPLRPDSLPLFSQSDRKQLLTVVDVHATDTINPQRNRFLSSRFAIRHRVVSLIRISFRTTPVDQIEPAARMLLLWELFLSYRTPRTPTQLEAAATLARQFLESNSAAMRQHPSLIAVMNLRNHADRLRRLDKFVGDYCQGVDALAPAPRSGRGLQETLDKISALLLACCDLPSSRCVLGLHHVYQWTAGDPSSTIAQPFHRFHRMSAAASGSEYRTLCARGESNVRSVAHDGRSRVYLASDAGEGQPSTSITLPLFVGENIRWILSIEAVGVECDASAIVRLVRLIPPVERAIDAIVASDAVSAARADVALVGRLVALPLSPRSDAITLRLQRVAQLMKARIAALIHVDGGECELVVAGSNGESRLPRRLEAAGGTLALISAFQKDRALRLFSIALSPDEDVAYTFFRNFDSQSRYVSRILADAGSSENLRRTVAEADLESAGSCGNAIVSPLWRYVGGEESKIRGVLILTGVDLQSPLFPRDVLRLDEVARTFADAMTSIEMTDAQTTLSGWAAAGVGPIHQLVKVAAECLPGGAIREADERNAALEVINEQLWVLHQIARPGAEVLRSSAPRVIPLVDAVNSGTLHGRVLAGETQLPPVLVTARAANCHVTQSGQKALNAILSCLLSNAFTYGSGGVSVNADVDDNDVEITVENWIDFDGQFDDESVKLASEGIEEAARIADRVAEGSHVEVFHRLAELAPKRGLRGVGTWLAARVAKELLGGSLSIKVVRPSGAARKFLVRAVLRFASP